MSPSPRSASVASQKVAPGERAGIDGDDAHLGLAPAGRDPGVAVDVDVGGLTGQPRGELGIVGQADRDVAAHEHPGLEREGGVERAVERGGVAEDARRHGRRRDQAHDRDPVARHPADREVERRRPPPAQPQQRTQAEQQQPGRDTDRGEQEDHREQQAERVDPADLGAVADRYAPLAEAPVGHDRHADQHQLPGHGAPPRPGGQPPPSLGRTGRTGRTGRAAAMAPPRPSDPGPDLHPRPAGDDGRDHERCDRETGGTAHHRPGQGGGLQLGGRAEPAHEPVGEGHPAHGPGNQGHDQLEDGLEAERRGRDAADCQQPDLAAGAGRTRGPRPRPRTPRRRAWRTRRPAKHPRRSRS